VIMTEQLVQRSDRVVFRTIGGEKVLVPITGTSIDMTRLYLLNDTAAAVWDLLAEPRTVASLCELVAMEYQEPAEALRQDVEDLLAELAERNLVVAGGARG
jgi:hypothetical protein